MYEIQQHLPEGMGERGLAHARIEIGFAASAVFEEGEQFDGVRRADGTEAMFGAFTTMYGTRGITGLVRTEGAGQLLIEDHAILGGTEKSRSSSKCAAAMCHLVGVDPGAFDVVPLGSDERAIMHARVRPAHRALDLLSGMNGGHSALWYQYDTSTVRGVLVSLAEQGHVLRSQRLRELANDSFGISL